MVTKNLIEDELLVVGVASSAGGLDPLRDMLSKAICHENMAYILVPHLSREYESALPKILDGISNLKTLNIESGTSIEPCHLYILPAGYYARVEHHRIVLDPRPDRGVNHSANVLFKSLARSFRQNAIGVVLSGAAVGYDGSEGIVEIKRAGGHTYAQDPKTAIYPNMPKAAINTGCVDSVLSAEQIGHELTLVSWASD